jgi:predicted transcriptional regulator YheO
MPDSTVLSVLKQISGCLARQFGNNCETVIHELSPDNHSGHIVHIENGHVSQRLQQDESSLFVLPALEREHGQPEDRIGYLTRTQDGRILKSSTLYVRDEQNTITAVFTLNFDITGLLAFEGIFNSLVKDGQETAALPVSTPQHVNELLDDLIRQSIKRVGKPAAIMTKEEKIQAIKFLDDAGAFLVTRSGDRISKEFGISKYTMYSYIDANRARCL